MGPIGKRASIRHAVAFEPFDPLVAERRVELVEEAGFPHPRLADHAHDLPVTCLDASEAIVQEGELAAAAGELGQAAGRAHLEPAPPPTASSDPIDDHRLALPSDLDATQRLAEDVALDESMRRLGHQDRSRLRLGLHARGDMGGIADRGVVHAQIIADAADHDRTGVDPDTQSELRAVLALELRAIAADGLLNGQRRLHGPQWDDPRARWARRRGPSGHRPDTDSRFPHSGAPRPRPAAAPRPSADGGVRDRPAGRTPRSPRCRRRAPLPPCAPLRGRCAV